MLLVLLLLLQRSRHAITTLLYSTYIYIYISSQFQSSLNSALVIRSDEMKLKLKLKLKTQLAMKQNRTLGVLSIMEKERKERKGKEDQCLAFFPPRLPPSSTVLYPHFSERRLERRGPRGIN